MGRKRYSEEQIIFALKQADSLNGFHPSDHLSDGKACGAISTPTSSL
ncbi:MAG: hypothetical protein JXK93_12170 [Sphaerochaetaceae bacterium]|nr:hypothetical protein [Sphaerochaetaceae bacterium]